MALTQQQLAEISLWIDQQAAALQQQQDAAAAAAVAAWTGFSAWYSSDAVTALAGQMARLSQASQNLVVGAAQTYIAHVTATMAGTPVTIPRTTLPPLRNGAPLTLVHSRPAEAYKKAIATGSTHAEAVAKALNRAANLQVTDMSLVERSAEQELMRELGITQFRRVVRPELSKHGSCGMCIVASDNIYHVAVLMPMHDRCNCETLPIVNGEDPAHYINVNDLGHFYGDAGGTQAPDLKKTRYVVNEHGEYGPVLSREGDAFRDRGKVALEDDPERAGRMLAKALPVLERMEADGGPVDPLQYQRDLVARLSDITAA